MNYFADIVIEFAEKKRLIRKNDIKNYSQLKSSNKKELFEVKIEIRKFDKYK